MLRWIFKLQYLWIINFHWFKIRSKKKLMEIRYHLIFMDILYLCRKLSDRIMINRIEINLTAPHFASLNTYVVCIGNVSIYIKNTDWDNIQYLSLKIFFKFWQKLMLFQVSVLLFLNVLCIRVLFSWQKSTRQRFIYC